MCPDESIPDAPGLVSTSGFRRAHTPPLLRCNPKCRCAALRCTRLLLLAALFKIWAKSLRRPTLRCGQGALLLHLDAKSMQPKWRRQLASRDLSAARMQWHAGVLETRGCDSVRFAAALASSSTIVETLATTFAMYLRTPVCAYLLVDCFCKTQCSFRIFLSFPV